VFVTTTLLYPLSATRQQENGPGNNTERAVKYIALPGGDVITFVRFFVREKTGFENRDLFAHNTRPAREQEFAYAK